MKYTDAALFTDLDGTLFNSRSQVSQKNIEAIRRFTSQGGLFGISTGRGPINARGMLPGVELNSWSVVLNGGEAYHYREGRSAARVCLDKQAAQRLITWTLRELPEVNITLFTEDQLLFVSDPDLADPWYVETHQPLNILSLEEAWAYDWLKILFCAPRPVLERLKAHGKASGAEPAMVSVDTNPVYVEYMPPGVNKGSCLKNLRSLPEYQGRTFIAIGDYYNDLELLQEADVAVAVANALPQIQAVADHVICSNDEDALAYLIDTLIPSL